MLRYYEVETRNASGKSVLLPVTFRDVDVPRRRVKVEAILGRAVRRRPRDCASPTG